MDRVRRIRLGRQLQDIFRALEWLRDDCSEVDWAIAREAHRLLPAVDAALIPSAPLRLDSGPSGGSHRTVLGSMSAGLLKDAPDEAMAMRQHFRQSEVLIEQFVVAQSLAALRGGCEETEDYKSLLSQHQYLSSLKSARALYPKPQSMIEQAQSSKLQLETFQVSNMLQDGCLTLVRRSRKERPT